MFRSDRLTIWDQSVEFAGRVDALVQNFPYAECHELVDQLRCAAVRISSNVAEGATGGDSKKFARYVERACGALNEVMSLLGVCRHRCLLSAEEFEFTMDAAREFAQLLGCLRRSLPGEP
jgi:four helix bundle protein